MNDQKMADFMPANHKAALSMLSDGLCTIREAALYSPEHASKVADVLHNIPGILAGEDRGGDAYLVELLAKGRALISDQTYLKGHRVILTSDQVAELEAHQRKVSRTATLVVVLAVAALALSAWAGLNGRFSTPHTGNASQQLPPEAVCVNGYAYAPPEWEPGSPWNGVYVPVTQPEPRAVDDRDKLLVARSAPVPCKVARQ